MQGILRTADASTRTRPSQKVRFTDEPSDPEEDPVLFGSSDEEDIQSSDDSAEEFDPDPGLPQSELVRKFLESFPQTSDDPEAWRREPRKVRHVPWKPNRPEGHSELNFNKDMSVALMFLKMMQPGLERVLRETNKYARMRVLEGLVGYSFAEVEWNEFIVWLGVYLGMHACPKADMAEYWYSKTINATPGYSDTFPFRRFKEILHNLHLVDSEEAAEEGQNDPNSVNRDRVYKVRQFKDETCEMFRKARAPCQNIALDEAVSFYCYL